MKAYMYKIKVSKHEIDTDGRINLPVSVPYEIQISTIGDPPIEEIIKEFAKMFYVNETDIKIKL